MNRFDKMKTSSGDDGGLASKFRSLKMKDEVDQVSTNDYKSSTSVFARPPVTPSSTLGMSTIKSRLASSSVKSNANSHVGAVNEETFLENFEKVPVVQIYSGRDVDKLLKKCHDVLKNKNEDWENRVDCLKKIRSLIVAGALKYDEFYENLNRMLPAFFTAVEDLRSVVVREACITVAFLSKCLENKLDHFAESLLNNLINLVQKSQKVFTTSGVVCVRFILQHTHAPRLIPIIANNLNSKSKDIRRACCEFVSLILQTWHTHTIEKHVSVIQEAIKKGITDADAEARSHSRKAYNEFAQHFPDAAENLKNSLDFTYRKLLFSGSNSGSSSSLSKCGGDVKSSIPRSVNVVSVRSNSAIDLQAVKRANTRAQYAAMARQKFGSGAASSAAKTKPITTSTSSTGADNRVGRTKNRVSISQPSSRSGSPSSRFSSYSHYLSNTGTSGYRSRKSSIGNDTSRETSPNRSYTSPYAYRSGRTSTQPIRRPVIAQKILQQSREAETELADALGNISDLSLHSFRPASRSLFRTPDDHSDESETSSMCSETSFDSFRRTSDSMSWNGSQHRLYRDMSDVPLKDVVDIVTCCESSHWNERKKGLISLQYYIQEGNKLELSHLKRIMEIFLKIFNDPHIKVFSMFLDALNELILSHSMDLCFCLHLLLTRLFNKLGTDLLNSVHSKIIKTLDNVFDVFPHDLQIQSVFRFLVDPTQTPNNRVKVAALNYMIKLTSVVDPCTAFSSNNNSNKDYATMALTKMISWTTADGIRSSPELRKVSQEAILSLFNLNTSQVTRRFATMSADYQEIAANLCKSKCTPLSTTDLRTTYKNYKNDNSASSLSSSVEVNLSCGSPNEHVTSDRTDGSLTDVNYKSFCKNLTNDVNNHSRKINDDHGVQDTNNRNNGMVTEPANRADNNITDSQVNDASTALKTYLEELSLAIETGSHQTKQDILLKLTKLVQECPSDAIITHFRSLLGKIVKMMTSSESAVIKETLLKLLQLIIKRKTVIFLLKQFSDLVITTVIKMCADTNKDVVKAAENCAIVLSTHLPEENVVRVIVPLINTFETAPVKLISIKMLTRLVECSDNKITFENINQIMPVLLVAYDDLESSVRKAAVFCMVALYRQSDEMKSALEPFIDKLQGAKKKLLELYIERAEQGSSMPTSPKHS